jgi:hypothetical protein
MTSDENRRFSEIKTLMRDYGYKLSTGATHPGDLYSEMVSVIDRLVELRYEAKKLCGE